MSDSVRPHRRRPTRLPHLWDSPGKNTGVGCHFLLQCMKGKSESEVAQSCPTLCDPMVCSLPGSPSMGFSRQEYWSGVPLPSPIGILLAIKRMKFCSCSNMDGLGGHNAKWNVRYGKTNTVCYHLNVDSKKSNKLVNVTNKKRIHRYWEQTSGYQWREKRQGGIIGVGD